MDESTENLSTRRIIDSFYCYFIPMISFMQTWTHDTDWSASDSTVTDWGD